jgi:hypothetical protein
MAECNGTKLPELDKLPEEVLKAAKDVAYIGIGFAVLGARQAQERIQQARTDAQRAADERRSAAEEAVTKVSDVTRDAVKDLGGNLRSGARDVDARIAPLAERVDALLDQWESTLPESARTQVAKAREAARKANSDMRSRLGLVDDEVAAA